MTATITEVMAPERTDNDPGEPTVEAPYGVNPKTGKPYKVSAERRAQMSRDMVRGRQAAREKAGRVSKGTTRRATSKTTPTDYRAGVVGLLQIPAFVLGILGRRNEAFGLDAATVTLHSGNIAEAVNETAQQDERIAAALDKMLEVGPYGALFAAMMPVALQIAANHGKIPANKDLGILSPGDIADAMADLAAKAE